MKIAVCFITSGREAYSFRTAESFVQQNGWCANAPCEVVMYHGDDASEDNTNESIASNFGFTTLLKTRPDRRLGANRMRQALVEEVLDIYPATHILVLENDWESVRPIPFEHIVPVLLREDVHCARLYGVNKDAAGLRPAGADHAGKKKRPAGWKPLNEHLDIGDVHFGAPPAITRVKEFLHVHAGTKADSQVMRKSGELSTWTVRVRENVVFHIGHNRTPGFRQ